MGVRSQVDRPANFTHMRKICILTAARSLSRQQPIPSAGGPVLPVFVVGTVPASWPQKSTFLSPDPDTPAIHTGVTFSPPQSRDVMLQRKHTRTVGRYCTVEHAFQLLLSRSVPYVPGCCFMSRNDARYTFITGNYIRHKQDTACIPSLSALEPASAACTRTQPPPVASCLRLCTITSLC